LQFCLQTCLLKLQLSEQRLYISTISNDIHCSKWLQSTLCRPEASIPLKVLEQIPFPVVCFLPFSTRFPIQLRGLCECCKPPRWARVESGCSTVFAQIEHFHIVACFCISNHCDVLDKLQNKLLWNNLLHKMFDRALILLQSLYGVDAPFADRAHSSQYEYNYVAINKSCAVNRSRLH